MIMGFNWIMENKLAASGRPGLYNEYDEDIQFLRRNEFNTIVTLTETKLDEEFYGMGFDIIHFPIRDMGIPMPRNAYEVCTDVKQRMDEGQVILVHCKAGLGRTGTILACILIEMGYNAEEAISEVRRNVRLAIQNQLQEGFVRNYEKYHLSQVNMEE